MRLKILLTIVALCFIATGTPITFAQTPSNTATINNLLVQIALLQAELAKIRGEVKETIKDGLKEGMTDPDIKKIQELLASDKKIYPEGKVDGYFDAKTKKAIKRFQKTHKLAVTGRINSQTKMLMLEYRKENAHKAPEGFLQAPGIKKKVQDNICDRVQRTGWGNFCKDKDDALLKELDYIIAQTTPENTAIQSWANDITNQSTLGNYVNGSFDYTNLCTQKAILKLASDADAKNGTGEDYCHSTATTWVYAAQLTGDIKEMFVCVDHEGFVLKTGVLSSATGASCETLNP